MKDIKKLLEARKVQRKKRPKFIRETHGIQKRINDKWRKPRGRHSKLRHQKGGHRTKVKVGFRTNSLVRGYDNSGLMPVVVHSLSHIQLLDKNTHGAIIGGSVGDRKRLLLLGELKKQGVKVLNLKEGHEKIIQERMNQRKQEKEEFAAKKEKQIKKTEKKGEKQVTEEEKQAQEKKEKDKVLTKEQK